MKNSYLRFVGTGSAFNTKLSCTSAYMKYDDNLLLIDCGGPIYEKLINSDILDNQIKGINIFITHTHPDHCGSLGDLIFHCKYTLGIKPKVYCVNRKIKDMLEINYVPPDIYDFIQIKYDIPVFIVSKELKQIKIIPIETKHIKNPYFKNSLTSGFLFKIKDTTFYYSGDSYEIPDSILELLKNDQLNYIYQDTCGIDYPDNVHFPLEKLKAIIPINYRCNVYCMHIDNYLKEEDILSNGFNIVKNEINKKETIAIYPGSFDPITYGHLNMIEKASKMFDKVIVSVLVNEDKHPTFTMEERVDFIKKCIKKYSNVEVKMFKGLLAEFAKQENANVIVKGLRNVTDFEYELHQGMINKQLNSEVDTTFLIPDAQYQNMSSSVLRAIAGYKGDIDWITPKEILGEVKSKYYYY